MDSLFQTLAQDDAAAHEWAKTLLNETGFSGVFTRVQEGSALVFYLENKTFLKVFDPYDLPFFQNEVLFLKQLNGKLPVATPQHITSGLKDGIPYLLMSRVPGRPLNRVWDEISADNRAALLEEVGQILRQLHALPVSDFQKTSHAWKPLMQNQLSKLADNHANYGLEPPLLQEIITFVQQENPLNNTEESLVPLHTELMPEHLFVTETDGVWSISGLIDFEPAMIGHPEYDFAAVGVFLCPGQPHLLRQFFQGYGYPTADLTPAFSRRLMAWLLLHRYCNLPWFRNTIPDGLPRDTIRDLQNYWFFMELPGFPAF